MHKCGQSPGEGDYMCIDCGQYYHLNEVDTLTPCMNCSGCTFEKG